MLLVGFGIFRRGIGLGRRRRIVRPAARVERMLRLGWGRGRTLASSSNPGPTWMNKPLLGKVPPEATNATPGTQDAFPPNFSRRSRRQRYQQAVQDAVNGNPFQLPQAQRQPMPGPVGAVMNVLRDTGAKTTYDLFDIVNQRYPGVLRSVTHLREKILKNALCNKVIKVRASPDSQFKDHWAIRRRGQPKTVHPHLR